jgi:hypothetical protein
MGHQYSHLTSLGFSVSVKEAFVMNEVTAGSTPMNRVSPNFTTHRHNTVLVSCNIT